MVSQAVLRNSSGSFLYFSGHFDENQTLPWLFQMRRLTIVVYNVHVHVTIKITALLESYVSSWQGAVGSGSPGFSLCV